MLFGLLSDIHSNIEALDASIAALKERGAKSWIVLGDIVGYGADPNAVIERLAGLSPRFVVTGNHDLAAVGKMNLEWFNPAAADAANWTKKALSAESRTFLEALPLRVEQPTFTAVHGSPRNPAEEYLLTPGQFLDNLQHYDVSPCFVGHSHLPMFFVMDGAGGVRCDVVEGPGRMSRGEGHCAFNPGSVGQPRDLDPRASCGLYDDEAGVFEWVRVAYPIEQAQKKIRDAGLPDFLAERLAMGR